jgi:hypothetical protein
MTDDPNRRWAGPDLTATAKLDSYGWQDEFRLVFSLTDALRFENITSRIVQGEVRSRTAKSSWAPLVSSAKLGPSMFRATSSDPRTTQIANLLEMAIATFRFRVWVLIPKRCRVVDLGRDSSVDG